MLYCTLCLIWLSCTKQALWWARQRRSGGSSYISVKMDLVANVLREQHTLPEEPEEVPGPGSAAGTARTLRFATPAGTGMCALFCQLLASLDDPTLVLSSALGLVVCSTIHVFAGAAH